MLQVGYFQNFWQLNVLKSYDKDSNFADTFLFHYFGLIKLQARAICQAISYLVKQYIWTLEKLSHNQENATLEWSEKKNTAGADLAKKVGSSFLEK